MTIQISLILTDATFDGVTPRVYADATWTAVGPNRFEGLFPTGILVGVVDWLEILDGLEAEFGRVLDKVPPDVGSNALMTDLVLERAVTDAQGPEAAPPIIGTHTQASLGAGTRLREYSLFPTETAGISQYGGTGQVSTALFADGQAGIMVLPTGMRMFILGDPAAQGDFRFAAWLEPIASPQHWAWAAQSSQPDPVFI